MLNRLEEGSLFLDRIVFSDEATFNLSVKVNRHNITRIRTKLLNMCEIVRRWFFVLWAEHKFTDSSFSPSLPLRVRCTSVCWSTSWM
jgi:hypothetical protein